MKSRGGGGGGARSGRQLHAIARKRSAGTQSQRVLEQRAADRAARLAAVEDEQRQLDEVKARRVAALEAEPTTIEGWARRYAADPSAWLERPPKSPPWPDQKAGVDLLCERTEHPCPLPGGGCGGVVADDTGSGKTYKTFLFLLESARRRVRRGGTRFGPGCATLILVPKTLLHQWADQHLRHVGMDRLGVLFVETGAAAATVTAVDPARVYACLDAVVVTYDTLQVAVRSGVTGGLLAVEWNHLVVEEGATLVNENAAITEACGRLHIHGGRIMISATPLVNSSIKEVNGLLDFFGSTQRFPLQLGDALPHEYVAERALFHQLLDYFILRPAAVQPPQPDLEWVTLNRAERAVYDAIQAGTTADAGGGFRTPLRKAALSTALLLPYADRPPDRPPSSKIAALLAYLDRWLAADEKALVFCDWQKGLREFAHHAEARGYACGRLRASMTVPQRRSLIHRFQNQEDIRLLLVTPKLVVGVDGLQRANHVLFLAGWWHDKAEWQGYGRCMRPGQQRPVHFKKFVTLDTVDVDVLQTNQRKAARDETLFAMTSSGGLKRSRTDGEGEECSSSSLSSSTSSAEGEREKKKARLS